MLVELRADLGMPLGKQIAQSAHAACAFILGCFDFSALKWRDSASRELLGTEFSNILKIAEGPLSASRSTDSLALIKITDQGHTVFKGVPTETATFYCSPLDVQRYRYVPNEHTATKSTSVRTTQLILKSYRRKNPSTVVHSAVLQQCFHLIQALDQVQAQQIGADQLSQIIAWSQGSFAKITLVASDVDSMAEVLQKAGRLPCLTGLVSTMRSSEEDSPVVITIGPANKEDLDPITSSFKML